MTDHRLLVLLRDVSAITARYEPARSHADQCRAGFPATTIGAAPDTTPSSSSGGDGMPAPDRADNAYQAMSRQLDALTRQAQTLATIVDNWTPESWWTHQHQPAANQLADIDNGLWCPNHLAHGHHETRDHANRRTLCRWCDGIKRDVGTAPDRTLIDRRNRLARTTTADIDQFTARVGGKKKRRKSA